MKPQKFQIHIEQSAIDDLHYRLNHSRLPESTPDPGWRDGTDPAYMRDLLAYWAKDYDWRRAETEINAYPNYQVTIDGNLIHFIHLPSRNPKARALVLTHGWPDTFYRYLKVLPFLTEHYHLIVPSLPGYGFSGKGAKPNKETAVLWVRLVTEVLGYPGFYASGGDLGAGVTLALARNHQDKVRAVHLTDLAWEGMQSKAPDLSEAEQAFMQRTGAWFMTEGAYFMMHSTKPLTVAYGLNDSPAALAAWAASFANSGQSHNRVDEAFGGREAFLTNLSIYWFTQTAASAVSLYKRNAEASWGGGAANSQVQGTAPIALALYPQDQMIPREWAVRQGLNLRRYQVMPEGGHFAALELPQLFASELHEALQEIDRP